jgi:hypothetical protein
MAEDVRTIADEDLADRRVFEEEGSPEEGGDNADRLRLREEPVDELSNLRKPPLHGLRIMAHI